MNKHFFTTPEDEMNPQAREAATSQPSAWATPVSHLKVGDLPAGAVNLNVDGRQLTGPIKGFGQLWQKIYRVRFSGADVRPVEVIKSWKENFATFWPKGNRFYGSMSGIKPGDVALLNLAGPGGMTAPGGMPLISTGVMVIYADDESFTFMTPEGHMFAAIITFSAYEEEQTVAEIKALIRASDPIYELGLRIGLIHRVEDDFWQQTLNALARHYGVDGYVQQEVMCIDPRVQWSEAKNVWQNAAIRTGIYLITAPLRVTKKLIHPSKPLY